METWAIVAAKHTALSSGVGLGVIPAAGWDSLDGVAVGMLLAGIGLAVVSTRRVPSCQLPPACSEVTAGGSDPATGRRAARLRRRVDGLLIGMLSDDDADRPRPAAAAGHRMVRPATGTEQRFDAPAAWRGDYVDALHELRSADSRPLPSPAERREDAVRRFMATPIADLDAAREARAWTHGRALAPADHQEPARGEGSRDEDAARRWPAGPGLDKPGRAPRTGSEPAQTSLARDGADAAARDAGPKAGPTRADESFWGPRGAAEDGADAGHRGGNRSVSPAEDKPQHGRHKAEHGRHAKPRHAAPPASFGATLTRRLTNTKLTSRSATHAAG